ncbi:MAG: polyketide synthase, partial [Chloroflexi bacterium]
MKNNALLLENIVKETIAEVQLFDNSNNHAYEKSPATRVSEEGRQRELEEWRSSDIAIIGISGKFADSPNVEAFWRNLKAGTCCVKPIRRKDWETHTSSELGEAYNWGGMLESIDQFDPLFFNISPLEAARMDPQQRIFLHEAYKSFEDAGYSAEQLSDKKVGVFVGARSSDYQEQALLRSNGVLHLSELDSHLFLGNDMAILAARISYFLNLKGPSLTIDTASSSSLVAIHLACESIRAGEAEMALAGGVFAMSSPAFYAMAAKTQMLSPDGKCKAFDKSANGIVIGEGVGALVLKPLASALEDGDHIYGVIKGSAINQDGRTKGITAPNMLSQKDLLVSVYKKSAIDPETISYIEAHGTGSKLGDPIEVQALTEAFKTFTDKKQFCAIGSHKANFGHTIVSAGIASVFKVLLSMKYEKLPPTLNIEEINPQIDLQGSPFFINTELRTWKSHDGGKPRRAGISSFGLSGTNCHLILEEPPPHKARVRQQISPYAFFPLSARTKAALKQKVVDLIAWLKKEGEEYAIEDISYTLVQGRSHFSFRLAVV